jgi:hypothetical protein
MECSVPIDPKERKEEILDLWKLGFSGAEIANRVGTTRNAVLGTISRQNVKRKNIGLAPIERIDLSKTQKEQMNNKNSRKKPRVRRPVKELPPTLVPIIKRIPLPEITIEDSNLSPTVVSLLNVTGCRYIDTDTFCNAPVHNRSSWCEHHYKRVFTPFISRSQRV